MKPGPKPIPVEERFWSKVSPEPNTGCWLWMGASVPFGYGVIASKIDGRKLAYAHRVAWTLTNGAIPEGLKVLHRCDNPPCVNPAHLFLGTMRDNAQDMVAKGRHSNGDRELRTGSQNGRARLTEAQVIEIRKTYAEGAVNQAELATRYGVSRAAVAMLLTNRTWIHTH